MLVDTLQGRGELGSRLQRCTELRGALAAFTVACPSHVALKAAAAELLQQVCALCRSVRAVAAALGASSCCCELLEPSAKVDSRMGEESVLVVGDLVEMMTEQQKAIQKRDEAATDSTEMALEANGYAGSVVT